MTRPRLKPTTQLFAAPLALALTGCSSTPQNHENLNTTLWTQQAAEYELIAHEVFDRAEHYVDRVHGLIDSELPLAVVVDIDETTLDNSPFQAATVKQGTGFDPAHWDAWVAEGAAKPIPGAKEFITAMRTKGVEIIYISNRNQSGFDATLKNIVEQLDSKANPELLLLRDGQPDWGGDKKSRRELAESRYTVIAYLGDDLNDFISVYRMSPAERLEAARHQQHRFSNDWFLLPNPSYGSWERAVSKQAASPERNEVLKHKINTLESFEAEH